MATKKETKKDPVAADPKASPQKDAK